MRLRFDLLVGLLVLAVLQHVQGTSASGSTPCDCATAAVDEAAAGVDSLAGPWYEVGGRFLAIVVLIAFSAMFSGLTLGLLSLDISGLQIIIGGGAPDSPDVIAARTILPVREKGNLLLCTLLLGNVAVNSLCSILMADLTSGLVGFFVSTFLIVILGEIVPQAVCSRFALQVGRRLVPIVKVIMVMFYVVSKPIAMILDYALGEEMPVTYTKHQLSKLLEIQVKAKMLDAEESSIMAGAMRLKDHVSTVMTPLNKVFTLAADDKLNFSTVSKVFQAGYSRIPVREAADSNNFVGVVFAKDLILLDPEDAMPVQQVLEFFKRDRVMKVWADQTLQEVLAMFRQTRSHLALVQTVNSEGDGDPFYEVQGLVTMEDIVQVILQSKIEDEYDDTHAHRSAFDYAQLRLLDGTKTLNDLGDAELSAIAAHLRANCEAFQTATASGGALTMEETKALLRTCPVLELTKPKPGRSKKGAPAVVAAANATAAAPEAAVRVELPMMEPPLVRSVTAPRDPSMLLNAETKEGPTPVGRVRAISAHRDADMEAGLLYRRGKVEMCCTIIISGKLKVTAGRDDFTSDLGAWSILGDDALTTPAGQYVPDFSATIDSDVVRCIRISHAQFQAALHNFVAAHSLPQGSSQDDHMPAATPAPAGNSTMRPGPALAASDAQSVPPPAAGAPSATGDSEPGGSVTTSASDGDVVVVVSSNSSSNTGEQ